jgi:two-component system, sensor histidine kinase
MKLLLEGWKCRVAAASSAKGVDAALARLGSPPDIVIVDYRLPDGRTGLEVIEEVRARHPAVAAIVATGDISPDVLRETQAAGHPVLHKPLRPARLRSLLGASLRRRLEAAQAAAVELP